MVNLPISVSWAKGKEFKKPFYYQIGFGPIPDEALEQTLADLKEGDGQIVRLHRLDMGDLLKLGIANEMDMMSKALMASEAKDQTAKEAVASAVQKADNYLQMQTMINLVASGGLLEPKVHPVPEHDNARQKGLMYVDEIPWDDRMELFSVIFETEGLSDFREEQDSSVGNVADVPSVSLPADGSVDIRPDDTEGVLLQSGSVLLREESGTGDAGSGVPVEEKQEVGTGS